MNRALFLSRPLDWTRTPRAVHDAAREACAIERPAPNLLAEFEIASAVVFGVGLLGALVIFFL